MLLRTLVGRQRLREWAGTRDAQHDLPKLVRRLVHATAKNPKTITFRSEAGVQLGGWDGIVVADGGDPRVPEGPSGWELSCADDHPRKPQNDYESRTDDPAPLERDEATFVYLTPRQWAGKNTDEDGGGGWVGARRDEDRWRQVEAYDVDDLESWLEQAPAVHVWLSIRLGEQPVGVRDLETFWADWSTATDPALTSEFILAGRDEVVEGIERWLLESVEPSLGLRADSEDEALAVLAATVQSLPVEQRERPLSRIVVVDDKRSWRELVATSDSLILVPSSSEITEVAGAVRAGHRVVVPTTTDLGSAEVLHVPRLDRRAAADALQEEGIDRREAYEMAGAARRSLGAFRRERRQTPVPARPDWATPSHGRELIPVLFAGGWDEANEDDRAAVAEIADTTYAEVREHIVRWSNESDPPIRSEGEKWLLGAKGDAWSLLADYLGRGDLERFEDAAVAVLSEPDPQFDLPPGDRWLAGARGATPSHSSLLRKQLADTFALVGTLGEEVEVGAGRFAADYARSAVRRLLDEANNDWRIWASIADHLPLLVEAAPEEFLAAIETDLGRDEPIVASLFMDEDVPALAPSSPHTGVLRALETAARSEAYLSRAAYALVRLERIAPDEQLNSRPVDSLGKIFLLAAPLTEADSERRLRVLGQLREIADDVAWRLYQRLLPRRVGGIQLHGQPKWRSWGNSTRGRIESDELEETLHGLVSMLLEEVDGSGERWAELIEALPRLPLSQVERIVERLDRVTRDELPFDRHRPPWYALRELLHDHRTRAEQGGLVTDEVEERLEGLYTRLAPETVEVRYGWLFTHGPTLPRGRGDSWEEFNRAVSEARQESVESIFRRDGLDAIVDLVDSVERPEILGKSLGESELVEDEEELLEVHLGSEDDDMASFALGFASACSRRNGREWIEGLIRDDRDRFGAQQRAILATLLPCVPSTWQIVEDENIGEHYWTTISPYQLDDLGDGEEAIDRLLEYSRPYAALSLAGLVRHEETVRLSSAVVANVLESVLEADRDPGQLGTSFAHDLSDLLAGLSGTEVSDERVARLEWWFLPLLRRSHGQPRTLHQMLSESGEFFADFVCLLYRAEGEEPEDLDEFEAARIRQGRELLRSWNTLPATDEAGEVDREELRRWVREAHEAVAQEGREPAGLQEIGKALSAAPRGEDGIWPHPAVREVVEDWESDHLEQGLALGRINSRGVVTKDPFEGGDRERALAEAYEDDARTLADRWQRTASVLRRLAQDYRRWGDKEDIEAELRQDLD